MKGFVTNIEKDTQENNFFRKVLYTALNSQLVIMSINPNEEIGEETHSLDQFLRIESGTGKAVLDGVEHEISDGSAVLVPAGMKHNIINTGSDALKLYTLYSPAEHMDKTVHETKADAVADIADHYDGSVTEQYQEHP